MNSNSQSLELWGGVECTLNRVGDRYSDQLVLSGHRGRHDDIDRFAELGLRTLRFPILWESVSPTVDSNDWTWSDTRLQRCRELSIRPIAGLLHHGSGPRYTDLLDPLFPEKFAKYARGVAERYPWIDAYIPINEPLTTARFSALYAHWFPHRRDDFSFVRAVLNQARATVLAMREIRAVNPTAILIQSEDLGSISGSPGLQYQANFENERRWISWDLLCGQVHPEHPMWSYLRWAGASESDILKVTAEPCPPDLLGINHYITSERFLDTDIWRYPHQSHTGNGREQYVDVSAVGVLSEGIAGPENIYRDAWLRFGIPIVITEAHLGCTPDEQMRWLNEIWTAAMRLRGEGADIRAVTAWALLGGFDWDSLVTHGNNRYESGAFDISAGVPMRTLLGEMISGLAKEGSFSHSALAAPGWWRRPSRLLHQPRAEGDEELLYRAAS